MKKIFFVFLIICASFSLKAQIANDFTIYTPNGEKFTLFIHGKAVNELPSSSVTLENIHHSHVMATLDFEDPKIQDIKEKMLIISSSKCNECSWAYVFKVIEKKGKMRIRFVSGSEKKIQNPVQQIIINQK